MGLWRRIFFIPIVTSALASGPDVQLIDGESDYCAGEVLKSPHCQEDGMCIHFVKKPLYPAPAIEQRLEGTVVVGFNVRLDGCTVDRNILDSSNAIFDQAALEAVRRQRYSGPSEGMQYTIVFEIEDPKL